jgi:cytochrome b6-f complex iron-sulfur subunit
VPRRMMESGFVPDMGRRNLMNALLLGSIAGPLLVLPAVLIAYLTPAKAGGGGGGTVAKDALGNDVKTATWLAANPAG